MSSGDVQSLATFFECDAAGAIRGIDPTPGVQRVAQPPGILSLIQDILFDLKQYGSKYDATVEDMALLVAGDQIVGVQSEGVPPR
jgi:hypothetical protein